MCILVLTLQVEQEGVAVLSVQRLHISPAGLLKLKLFQKAGNLLLQSLEVRQSSEVSLCTEYTQGHEAPIKHAALPSPNVSQLWDVSCARHTAKAE